MMLACAAGSQSGRPQMSSNVVAALMRCLAQAPRLPPLDWGTPCRHLLTLATPSLDSRAPGSEAEEEAVGSPDKHSDNTGLAAACLTLALQHGSVASHGLGKFLDELMSHDRFSQLPSQLQQQLLTGLPEVLQSLSTQRAAAVVSVLGTLGLIAKSSQLMMAAWTGLARLMHSAQGSDPSSAAPPAAVTQAASGTVEQLLQTLPLPPLLLPGKALPEPSVTLDAAMCFVVADESSSSTSSRSVAAAVQHEEDGWLQKAWGAALACLQKMPLDKVSPAIVDTCKEG